MKMTPALMLETAVYLEQAGFRLDLVQNAVCQSAEHIANVVIYDLRRGDDEHIVLECWEYSDGETRYFLALEAFHGLSSKSFRLDSWIARTNQVEFKFYALAGTGMGLAFVLTL